MVALTLLAELTHEGSRAAAVELATGHARARGQQRARLEHAVPVHQRALLDHAAVAHDAVVIDGARAHCRTREDPHSNAQPFGLEVERWTR